MLYFLVYPEMPLKTEFDLEYLTYVIFDLFCSFCCLADNSDANNSDDSEELFQHVQNFHRGKAKELSFVQQALGRSLSDGGKYNPFSHPKRPQKAPKYQRYIFSISIFHKTFDNEMLSKP